MVPLSRVRARLAGPRGVRRIDALLSAADPAAEVAALSVPDLHQLVQEVGFAEATDLIALATPEQVRGCIDLDAWDRDRVHGSAVEPWLAAIIEAGFEKLGQMWEGLDPELAALLLARWGTIFDLSLGEEPPEDAELLWRSPDSFFAVVVTAEADETAKLVLRLLDDLYRADAQLARHTLMTARSEPTPELEEQSFRWRAGRMADLGYIDYYEALAVFRPLDPTQVTVGEGTQDKTDVVDALPVPLAEQLIGKSFLARALDQIGEADEQQRLEGAFLLLSNQVLSALRIQPADPEAVRFGADYAASTLAMGLEIVARGDVARGADALRSIALQRLFRVGYGAALRLTGFARAIARRAATAGEPMISLRAALAAERPMFPREMDQPAGAGGRPFESTADLRAAARGLTELALRIAIAETLGADLVALAGQPQPRPDLDDFARTALARMLAGGALDAAPLSPEELARLPRTLPADARGAAAAALDRHLDAAQVGAGRDLVPQLVARWLDDLDGLDPAHPSGLITSSRRE
ncbi:MAG TPA: DUF6178 family protein [Kofleriaceae bacterium]|nr:DUF6178 family protein [Kofleriaceae bacterium]